MRYISANKVKNSDHESKEFICLNNCGAFLDTEKRIVTSRPSGRMDFLIIYISDGEIELTDGGENIICGAGSVILFRPHEPQLYHTGDKKTSFYWLHFSGSEAKNLMRFYSGRVHHVGAFSEFEEFCHDAEQKFSANPWGKLYCEGKLISLIALLSQKLDRGDAAKKRDLIEPALRYIHTNFSISKSNGDYAKMCLLSKAHFIRTFHECTGMPPQKYRAEILVREAKQLLKSGFSVGDVAEFLGFEDRFYFSRLFKKHVGLSPANYAK